MAGIPHRISALLVSAYDCAHCENTYNLLTHFTDDKHYHLANFRSGAPVSQSNFNDVFLAQRVILLRTLQRMVSNHSVAEDLLQETYLRVRNALNERPITHLEPFVFQTARNLALDHLRARRIHARTIVEDAPLSDVESVVAPQATLEDATHAKRLLEGLSASLGQLTQRQQRIFILSRLNGCSYIEIADQLGVSPSTVQKELKLIMAICVGVATRLDHV
jgi:RNA polymerase sigma factor (sigma-70 family)